MGAFLFYIIAIPALFTAAGTIADIIEYITRG